MNQLRIVVSLVLLTMLACSPYSASAAAESADAGAIRALMTKTFDKPEDRLSVDPIVTEGDAAIAGWSQGDMGGRALLRRKGHVWVIVLCGGDALKESDLLENAGIPKAQAARLVRRLAEEEKRLAPTRLALFSRFDGIVTMEESGAHPPVAGHSKAHP